MDRKLARYIAIVVPLSLVLQSDRDRSPPPYSPANRSAGGPASREKHESFLEIARKGNIDLLFVGDSITDWFYWPVHPGETATGIEVWNANFGSLKAANFGIAGDTTQHAIWRLQRGELEGFRAKLIVLMLGTNNIKINPVDEIVDGHRLILEEFKKQQPQAKVLLLGVFPRGHDPENPLRTKIIELNTKLSRLGDGKQVVYMDINDKLLEPDGVLSPEVMTDGLHPTAKGYQIWADAIMPTVRTLME